MSQRLLLVGFDAADWQIIGTLPARGEMTYLAGPIARGMRGSLGMIYSPLSRYYGQANRTLGARPPIQLILA